MSRIIGFLCTHIKKMNFRKSLLVALAFCAMSSTYAQRQTGLLWQITGNGLTKPSYVYGTMHVSDKVAFHLGDPFFKAIQSVDIVALEQNLDSVYDKWLSLYSRMIRDNHGSGSVDYETFELNEYKKDNVAAIMQQGPLISNSILYRVSQLQIEFEEETYLDMLIYRLGKKYNKRVTGVEDFLEAERLTTLASAKKVRRKDAMGGSEGEALQDFYRTGDLTAIDSLNKVKYTEHYNEYMLYRRNKNMVAAMQKLMQSGSVFCGVGCAHLPGNDGVLKLLETMGYTVKSVKSQSLKPSKMLEKSKKIMVNSPLSLHTSSDNFFSANLPSKIQPIYLQNRNTTLYVSLDVPAGAQYLVYRYQDFPSLRNKTSADVLKSMDSFLYEIVIGNIDKTTTIQNDASLGRNTVGYDINFTRKNGDKGRYKIFHTGSDIVLVGVTGIKTFAIGKESNAFFNSFKLTNANVDQLIKQTTPDGIFTFEAPGAITAPEKIAPVRDYNPDFNYQRFNLGKYYSVLYRSMFDGLRLNPDTTELLLSCESFAYQNKLVEKKAEYKVFQGYPARYAEMEDKEGNVLNVRAILRGSKYLLQVLKGNSNGFADPFFENLKINNPQVEGTSRLIKDTFCHFTATVNAPTDRNELSKQLEIIHEASFFMENKKYAGLKRLTWFSPQNDREFIEIEYTKFSRYDQYKDSTTYWNAYLKDVGYTNLEILKKKFTHTPSGTKLDVTMGDTGSSRRVIGSYILNGDEFVSAIGFYDSISGIGNFTKTFFETFQPITNNKNNIFKSKVPLWVEDINSADSSTRRKAWDGFENLYVDSNNVELLAKVYDTLHSSNQLVERKRALIFRMGSTKCQKMIPVFEKIYNAAGDTAAYQTAIISSLASLKSKASYAKLKELFFKETPVPDSKYNFNLENAISDSLALASTMYPELFDKMNIDEYKNHIVDFAVTLLDSHKLKPEAYKSAMADLLSEANILVKKVLSSESSKKAKAGNYDNDYSQLTSYIKLLLPFKEEAKVITFLDKVKTVKQRDKRLDYYVLLLKNNYPVEDSVFNNLANEREFAYELYYALDKAKHLEKFPKSNLTKANFSKNVYYSENRTKYVSGSSTEIDSISVTDSAVVRYWDYKAKSVKSGTVYLLKYNRKKKKSSYEEDEDNEEKEKDVTINVTTQYYYGIVGPQPLEKDSFNGKRFILNSEKEKTVEKDSKMNDDFKKLIRMSQILLIRPSFYGYDWANNFYGGSDEEE